MKSFLEYYDDETPEEKKRREKSERALDAENSDDAMDDRVVPYKKDNNKLTISFNSVLPRIHLFI